MLRCNRWAGFVGTVLKVLFYPSILFCTLCNSGFLRSEGVSPKEEKNTLKVFYAQGLGRFPNRHVLATRPLNV